MTQIISKLIVGEHFKRLVSVLLLAAGALMLIILWSPAVWLVGVAIVFNLLLTLTMLVLLRLHLKKLEENIRINEEREKLNKKDLDVLKTMVKGRTNMLAAEIEQKTSLSYAKAEAVDFIASVLKLGKDDLDSNDPGFQPELGVVIVKEILAGNKDSFLGLGSGFSTIIAAATMKNKNSGRVIAVEYDKHSFDKTNRLLEKYDLNDWATVYFAPLVSKKIGGDTYLWPDTEKLDIFAADLLLVDDLSKKAIAVSTYPALTLLDENINEDTLIVIDNYGQQAQKESVESWVAQKDNLFYRSVPTKREIAIIESKNPKSFKTSQVHKDSNINKIFGIGLSKTATTSLGFALEQLGFSCINYPRFLHYLSEYDAAEDIQIANNYQLLDRKYPGSKFILTTRDIQGWNKSIEKHFNRANVPSDENPGMPDWLRFKRNLYLQTYGTVEYDKEKMTSAYNKHTKEVMNYFKNREKDLLILDIFTEDGWKKLCDFLEIEPPPSGTKFPVVNVSPDSKN